MTKRSKIEKARCRSIKQSLALLSCGILLTLCLTQTTKAQIAIAIKGLESEQDKDLTTYLSETIIPQHQDDTIEEFNIEALRRDALDALYAKSYYSADITTDQDKDSVTINIKTGQPYKIGKIQIKGIPFKEKIDLETGDSLDARKILDAQSSLYKKILSSHCFYTLDITHEVELDPIHHTGNITFIIKTGAPVTFGTTGFIGADNIKRSHLNHFIQYKQGDCWQADKVEQSKTALLQTGLLSLVQVKYPDHPPKPNEAVNVMYELKERSSRSIKLGASFYTDEGAGLIAKWNHRNFWGAGESLTIDLSATQLNQSIGLDISKPFFLRDDQNLTLSLRLKNKDSDAYAETGINGAFSLNRQINDNLNAGVGVGLDMTHLKEEKEESENYGLLSMPAFLTYDTRDNILDPHQGLNANLSAEPFIDMFGQSSPFFKTRLTTSTYFDLGNNQYDPVFALRGSIGSILGASTDDLPASKRFFAGGGNSIRGFGYQQVGPFDQDNDPAGGRSIIETSAEIRLKLTEKIGGVAFIDGGNVYDAMIPDFDNGLYWGSGVGMRYYTDFAPIRFDIAVPLNKKEHLDQNFQIYISIGQAF